VDSALDNMSILAESREQIRLALQKAQIIIFNDFLNPDFVEPGES